MTCAADATKSINAPGGDATIFEPVPANFCAVINIKDNHIKEAWLTAYRKELETIINSETFTNETTMKGEYCTPIMDKNAVKLKSDGTLDKVKNHLVVRGDLQHDIDEDKWSPTASLWALKLILAHVARLWVRV
jgi:hypothetical protein